MDFKITHDLRPCKVAYDDKVKNALFHMFTQTDGNAVVEFEGGECTTVPPWAVTFVDNEFVKYCFGDVV